LTSPLFVLAASPILGTGAGLLLAALRFDGEPPGDGGVDEGGDCGGDEDDTDDADASRSRRRARACLSGDNDDETAPLDPPCATAARAARCASTCQVRACGGRGGGSERK